MKCLATPKVITGVEEIRSWPESKSLETKVQNDS